MTEYKPVQSHETFVGMLCLWAHAARGGYGYTILIPAKVVALNPQGDRVQIEVHRRDGSVVRRSVRIENLRHVRVPARGGC